MRRSLLAVGVALGIIAAGSIGRLQGQAQGDKVIYVTASHANYSEMQGSRGGVSTAPIWGDANVGAHATFSKFAPGYDAGLHTHTNDVWIVVIKGAYLYKDDAGEKRVSPGEFLRVPGGPNTGAAEIRKKAPCFTKSRRATLI